MDKKQTKPPAHQLLVYKLTETVDVLHIFAETADSVRPVILCEVLVEMAIPVEHQGEVVAKLRVLFERCKRWNQTRQAVCRHSVALERLLRELSEEDAVMEGRG